MMEPQPLFSRYQLTRRLARGGMAEVFLAVQRGEGGFEKRVAVKKILPMYSGISDFATMFRDEAHISSLLQHSGIAQVLDYGTQGSDLYLVLEYVDGPDLEEVLDRCRRRGILPPVDVVLYLAHRLAAALEYAHAVSDHQGRPMRLVHRDVSPPNVLIGTHGQVKLTDFGVAKAETRSSSTRPGVLRGKYAYMSPEQVRRLGMDHRSDIFSLGTLLYEALTGVNPFDTGNDFTTMENVSTPAVEPANWIRQDAPGEIASILQRCMADDPDQRYQDAGLLRRDLRVLMLSREGADEPDTMVAFLRDVFPERAPRRGGAEPVERRTLPPWEALSHRLSPMLVPLPMRLEAPSIRIGTFERPVVGVDDTTSDAVTAQPGSSDAPPEATTGRVPAVPADRATESGRHRRVPGALPEIVLQGDAPLGAVQGPIPVLTHKEPPRPRLPSIQPDDLTPDPEQVVPLPVHPIPAAGTFDELPLPGPRWPGLDGLRHSPRHDTPISEFSPVATQEMDPVIVESPPPEAPAPLPGARVEGGRAPAGPLLRLPDEDEDSVRTDPGFESVDTTATDEVPALSPSATISAPRLRKAGAGGTFGGGFRR